MVLFIGCCACNTTPPQLNSLVDVVPNSDTLVVIEEEVESLLVQQGIPCKLVLPKEVSTLQFDHTYFLATNVVGEEALAHNNESRYYWTAVGEKQGIVLYQTVINEIKQRTKYQEAIWHSRKELRGERQTKYNELLHADAQKLQVIGGEWLVLKEGFQSNGLSPVWLCICAQNIHGDIYFKEQFNLNTFPRKHWRAIRLPDLISFNDNVLVYLQNDHGIAYQYQAEQAIFHKSIADGLYAERILPQQLLGNMQSAPPLITWVYSPGITSTALEQ